MILVKLCEIMVKHVKSAFPPVPGGPCQNLDNTCKFHAYLGARAAGNAQKWENERKWGNSAEFHPFS